MTVLEEKRQLIELAINAGRNYESPRTGFIHYCYEDEEATDTIPIFENLCFCLALFRSYVSDNVQEGKERLERLLSFQSESGSFPIYLHQYPQQREASVDYFPLHFLEKHFGFVLKKPLKKNLLPPLCPQTIYSSKDASLVALHLQLEEKSLHSLACYWNFELGLYQGPLFEERQRGIEPELTLFDLMMANATRSFSPRILKPHPIHLQAALVFPTEEILPEKLLCNPQPLASLGKGFHLYRKVWQEEGHLHTFVCQDKGMLYEEGIFTYPSEIPEERERMELNFYLNYHPSIDIRINGEKGTVFRLGDTLTPTKGMTLCFELFEGEGEFLGHISRGNRPAQLLTKGFTAYDWKIGIRSLRRTSQLKMRMDLSFNTPFIHGN